MVNVGFEKPVVWKLKLDFQKGKAVIQKMLKGETCNFETSELSKREWNELMESFGFRERLK